jgi:hypothetical protein
MIIPQVLNAPHFMIVFLPPRDPILTQCIPCTPISYISLEYAMLIPEIYNLRNLQRY